MSCSRGKQGGIWEGHRKGGGTVLLLSAPFSSPQLSFPVYAYYACNIIYHLAKYGHLYSLH